MWTPTEKHGAPIDSLRTRARYETATSAKQAFQAARAFGRFQQQLANLPPPRLARNDSRISITRPNGLRRSKQAIAADAAAAPHRTQARNRVRASRTSRSPAYLLDAGLPERVTHNDTKFNNVLFDDATGEGICVIDLDTVMPGLALYDFGDMVRTTTSPADEDERDLSKVTMQFPMFEALVRGYLQAAGGLPDRGRRKAIPRLFRQAHHLRDRAFGFSPTFWPATLISRCIAKATISIAAARSSSWWSRSSDRKKEMNRLVALIAG